MSVSPSPVREYSTFGGTVLWTSRCTTSSRSSSRRCWISIFSLTPARPRFSSPLACGTGAVLGNTAGGRLADRALMPALTGLLGALVGVLVLAWFVRGTPAAMVAVVVLLGALAFAIVPGMEARVVTTAGGAPTLAVAVNASGFQLAAALAGWFGGWVITSGPGLASLYLVGAGLTAAGLVVAGLSARSDRRAPVASARRS